MTNEDWLALLKLGGAAAGAAGGMGAFGGAPGAVPTGDTMSGADLGGNLTAGSLGVPAPPPDFGGQGVPGQTPTPWSPTDNLGLPGAGQPGPGAPGPGPTPPPTARASPLPPARDITAPVLPPDAPAAPGYPPGSPAATPQSPLTADAVNATTASSDPRSWWQRNVSDPWDKANVVDPKTGLSPAQKALASFGSTAGGAATKAASSPTAPALSGGAGAYKPTPINAAQMALTREQQLELLRKRARTSMPWLNRLQQSQQGLMG
jgi:hypothetical protein